MIKQENAESEVTTPETLGVEQQNSDDGPVRTCVITRRAMAQERLLRLVLDPQGRLTPDFQCRLPGRAVYVYPQRQNLVELTKKRGALRRLVVEGSHASEMVKPDPEILTAQVEQGLRRLVLDRIGLARRAGKLWFGLRGMEEAPRVLQSAPRFALLAADTARHTREKVGRAVVKYQIEPVLELLDREQFGAACGRGPTAILCAARGGPGHKLYAAVSRWLTFVSQDDGRN